MSIRGFAGGAIAAAIAVATFPAEASPGWVRKAIRGGTGSSSQQEQRATPKPVPRPPVAQKPVQPVAPKVATPPPKQDLAKQPATQEKQVASQPDNLDTARPRDLAAQAQ